MAENFLIASFGMVTILAIMGYWATWRAEKYDKEMAASMPRMAQMA